VIANCGRDPLLGNRPDTPATSTSTSLDLAGWDARIDSAGRV
jgi:oligo-1,6-glucosidase